MDTINAILVPSARMVIVQVSQFVSQCAPGLDIIYHRLAFSKYIIKSGITNLLKILKLDELSRKVE